MKKLILMVNTSNIPIINLYRYEKMPFFRYTVANKYSGTTIKIYLDVSYI